MITAKRKIEQAIAQNFFLNPVYGDEILQRVQILTSLDDGEKITPRIEIVAGQLGITEGFEGTDSGELECELTVTVATSADDVDAPDADALISAVECLLGDSPAAVLAINKRDTGKDGRPIKGIYLYDLNIENASDETLNRQRMTVYSCNVLFRNDDG
jgi:hypothetical protein